MFLFNVLYDVVGYLGRAFPASLFHLLRGDKIHAREIAVAMVDFLFVFIEQRETDNVK